MITVSEAAARVAQALAEAYSAVRPLAEQPAEMLLRAQASRTTALFNPSASTNARAVPADYADVADRAYTAKDRVRAVVATGPVAAPTPVLDSVPASTMPTPRFGSRAGG